MIGIGEVGHFLKFVRSFLLNLGVIGMGGGKSGGVVHSPGVWEPFYDWA